MFTRTKQQQNITDKIIQHHIKHVSDITRKLVTQTYRTKKISHTTYHTIIRHTKTYRTETKQDKTQQNKTQPSSTSTSMSRFLLSFLGGSYPEVPTNSTKNDSSPDASTGDNSSKGDSPDRGSGGHVYAANLIISATSCKIPIWQNNNKKHRRIIMKYY